jgi:Flp pilus assembly protein TadD
MLRPTGSVVSSVHPAGWSSRFAGEPDPAPASSTTVRPGLAWNLALWGAVASFGASIAIACVDHPAPTPTLHERVANVADDGRDEASALSKGAVRDATAAPLAAAPVPVEPPSSLSTSTPSLLQQLALATDADDVVDHRAEGEALLRTGRVADAVVALRKALSKDASADVWGLLGDAYLRAGVASAGVACLEEAVALDVDDEELRRILTRQYLSQADGTRARLHAEEWVRLAPQDPTARQALGRAYSQLGMWRQAIDQFTLVVAVQPDNAWAHNNLGYAALQLGDTPAAIEHLERAVDGHPQQAFMFNNLGVAYERSGHVAFAHAAFSRAAELSPKYAQAAENRDRVQKNLDESTRVAAAAQLVRFRDDGAASDGSGTAATTTTTTPRTSTTPSAVTLELPPIPVTTGE